MSKSIVPVLVVLLALLALVTVIDYKIKGDILDAVREFYARLDRAGKEHHEQSASSVAPATGTNRVNGSHRDLGVDDPAGVATQDVP